MPTEDRRWRVDRKVSLGLILTLVGHLVVGIWYAARLDARVASVEAWTQDNKGTEQRLAKIEARIDTLRELLADRRQASR